MGLIMHGGEPYGLDRDNCHIVDALDKSTAEQDCFYLIKGTEDSSELSSELYYYDGNEFIKVNLNNLESVVFDVDKDEIPVGDGEGGLQHSEILGYNCLLFNDNDEQILDENRIHFKWNKPLKISIAAPKVGEENWYSSPAHLYLANYAKAEFKDTSKIVTQDNAETFLKGNANFRMSDKAKIHIKDTSRLVIFDNSIVDITAGKDRIDDGPKIYLHGDSEIAMDDECYITTGEERYYITKERKWDKENNKIEDLDTFKQDESYLNMVIDGGNFLNTTNNFLPNSEFFPTLTEKLLRQLGFVENSELRVVSAEFTTNDDGQEFATMTVKYALTIEKKVKLPSIWVWQYLAEKIDGKSDKETDKFKHPFVKINKSPYIRIDGAPILDLEGSPNISIKNKANLLMDSLTKVNLNNSFSIIGEGQASAILKNDSKILIHGACDINIGDYSDLKYKETYESNFDTSYDGPVLYQSGNSGIKSEGYGYLHVKDGALMLAQHNSVIRTSDYSCLNMTGASKIILLSDEVNGPSIFLNPNLFMIGTIGKSEKYEVTDVPKSYWEDNDKKFYPEIDFINDLESIDEINIIDEAQKEMLIKHSDYILPYISDVNGDSPLALVLKARSWSSSELFSPDLYFTDDSKLEEFKIYYKLKTKKNPIVYSNYLVKGDEDSIKDFLKQGLKKAYITENIPDLTFKSSYVSGMSSEWIDYILEKYGDNILIIKKEEIAENNEKLKLVLLMYGINPNLYFTKYTNSGTNETYYLYMKGTDYKKCRESLDLFNKLNFSIDNFIIPCENDSSHFYLLPKYVEAINSMKTKLVRYPFLCFEDNTRILSTGKGRKFIKVDNFEDEHLSLYYQGNSFVHHSGNSHMELHDNSKLIFRGPAEYAPWEDGYKFKDFNGIRLSRPASNDNSPTFLMYDAPTIFMSSEWDLSERTIAEPRRISINELEAANISVENSIFKTFPESATSIEDLSSVLKEWVTNMLLSIGINRVSGGTIYKEGSLSNGNFVINEIKYKAPEDWSPSMERVEGNPFVEMIGETTIKADKNKISINGIEFTNKQLEALKALLPTT